MIRRFSLALLSFFCIVISPFAFVGAASPPPSAVAEKKIGVTPGDFAELAKDGLRPLLEKKGYKVRVIEFNDYVQPNLALANGRLDLNIFQHLPYLKRFDRERRVDLEVVGQVPTAPLGLYGGKTKSIEGLKAGSSVAIPNDPTNLARALQILADVGWIIMKDDADPTTLTMKDIRKNPKKVVLIQLEAAQLPGALQDVDFAVVNGNYIVSAGLSLSSALAREKSEKYVNWAVARRSDLGTQFVKDVREALRSGDFKKFAREKFSGYQFPADWK